MRLDGLVAAQVEDSHIMHLAGTVQPANALLDAHGIPGQVIVDELVAELEIAPLCSALGADHDPHPLIASIAVACFLIATEGRYRSFLLANVEAAVEANRADAPFAQLLDDGL